ncbi:hypothetical protein ETB97_008918 [Aspergillus alliaceus]|uniref:Uncharacterized protein n=1 Tax=Petromyces alliaceus TaxID=209559 RepID=A0A8H6ADQ0_PETAA|nr:hypothetical protein ETB97_008918 [Aspergillus burnettii]
MPFAEPVTDETASGFDRIATADIDQILQQLTLGEKVAARYSPQCLLQEIEGLAPTTFRGQPGIPFLGAPCFRWRQEDTGQAQSLTPLTSYLSPVTLDLPPPTDITSLSGEIHTDWGVQ